MLLNIVFPDFLHMTACLIKEIHIHYESVNLRPNFCFSNSNYNVPVLFHLHVHVYLFTYILCDGMVW